MIDKTRDEFEAAIAEETGQPLVAIQLSRMADSYSTSALIYAWWAWQQSRKALVIALPPSPTVPDEPEEAIDDSFMDGYYAAQGMRNACAQNIKAAGLKVTP